jgi:hypothetical protein
VYLGLEAAFAKVLGHIQTRSQSGWWGEDGKPVGGDCSCSPESREEFGLDSEDFRGHWKILWGGVGVGQTGHLEILAWRPVLTVEAPCC